MLRVLSLPFYGSPPALLSKPRPGSWTGSWAFLTHSMSYSLLTGGRKRAGWTAGELHPAGGWRSLHAAWPSKTKGAFTETHWIAIVISHLGWHFLIKSFYCNVKHPAEMIEHLAYLSVVPDLTLIIIIFLILDQSYIQAVFVPYLLISICLQCSLIIFNCCHVHKLH